MDVFYKTSLRRLKKKVVAISILDQYKASPRLKIRRFMDLFKTSFGRLGSYMLFKEWECCRYSHIYTCSNVLTVIESVQPKNNKSFNAPVQYQNDAFMFVKFSVIKHLVVRLNVFFRTFQTRSPIVPFTFNVLEKTFRSIVKTFFIKLEL